jgi:hypothetical protein
LIITDEAVSDLLKVKPTPKIIKKNKAKTEDVTNESGKREGN